MRSLTQRPPVEARQASPLKLFPSARSLLHFAARATYPQQVRLARLLRTPVGPFSPVGSRRCFPFAPAPTIAPEHPVTGTHTPRGVQPPTPPVSRQDCIGAIYEVISTLRLFPFFLAIEKKATLHCGVPPSLLQNNPCSASRSFLPRPAHSAVIPASPARPRLAAPVGNPLETSS